MARAGYCSGCGNYVFLRPDGGCANGHGPEYISGPYEVPDAGAAPAPAPAYQQPPAYVQPGYAAPVAPPKKRRTGLIIALAIVGLLLLCGCGVGVVVLTGFNPFVSAEHQKVAVAGEFFRAVSTADLVGMTKTIPTDAAAAADPSFWIDKVGQSDSKSTLKSSSWEGDVLTQTFTDPEGAEQVIVLTAIDGDKVKASTGEGDAGVLTMVKEMTGWKVLALGSEDGQEFIRFTPEAIKKLQEEAK
jgi:hypothetical protein